MDLEPRPWDDWEIELPKPPSHALKATVLPRSSSVSEIFNFSPLAISREISKLSKESSKSSNSKLAERTTESPAEQMAKIFQLPAKVALLKDIANKFIMIHYIEYYEKQSLILDLAANGCTPLLVNLVKLKLSELQKDYLLDNSPLKLMLLSSQERVALNCAIAEFTAFAIKDTMDLQFLSPIADEVLVILSKSILPKYKQLKPRDQGKSDKGKILEECSIPALIKVLNSEIAVEKMIEVLAKQHCMENYFYYQQQKQVYNYAATATSPIEKQTLKKMIKDVGKEFILSNAPSELNIPSKLRSDFEEAMKDSNISVISLDPITKEVLNMMLRNAFPLYLKNNINK